MRKLASIQRVWKIEPIEGADRIELAHVLGWQCVANKGQFKEDDIAVYFEVDSFLPVREEFEFLRSSSYKDTPLLGEGFRLRTMKFRGQISQGLLLPISVFPELSDVPLEAGTDVTDLLGVKKWEIEERATTGGTIIGQLPANVPHTDETRIQVMPELIQAFAGKEYYISTKMDGSSHSINLDEHGQIHITGHNYEYKDDGKSSFYNLVKDRGIEARLLEYADGADFHSITIQGELCAPGIQKNRLRLTRPEWYVFTIMLDGKRIGLNEMLKICNDLKLDHVPIEEVGMDLQEKYPTVDALLDRADGQYPNGGAKEGIVIRTTEPEWNELIGDYLSMKVVSNKYLLKNE